MSQGRPVDFTVNGDLEFREEICLRNSFRTGSSLHGGVPPILCLKEPSDLVWRESLAKERFSRHSPRTPGPNMIKV